VIGQPELSAKSFARRLHAAFADFRLTIEDVVVADDVVWSRNVATGRHAGFIHRHPATGRSFRIDVVDIMRVQGGQIVEHWGRDARTAVKAPNGNPAGIAETP